MTTIKRERAFLWACLYLVSLSIGILVLGGLLVLGGNPMRVNNLGVVNTAGQPNDQFRAGEVVGIKRKICADGAVTIQSFPALVDSRGFLFALPINLAQAQAGCHDNTYGFILPDLPPGSYTYTNTVLFQNNLVGRNEFATFPPLRVRIIHERN